MKIAAEQAKQVAFENKKEMQKLVDQQRKKKLDLFQALDERKIELDKQKKRELLIQQQISAKEKEQHTIQSIINEERVNFRVLELGMKMQKRKSDLNKIAIEKQKLEKRLQNLRDTVDCHAEADWNRILSDTESFATFKASESVVKYF